MNAVQYFRSVPRYLAVRALHRRFPSVSTGVLSMLRYVELPEPRLPSERWVRLRPRLTGICGSDIATVAAKGSPYFSPLVSTPFVLGHEVVADVVSVGSEVTEVSVGERVVLEGALHCAVRGVSPICHACASGQRASCENVTKGDLGPGIQTGYCRDTGGGWSESFVAHEAQLLSVPSDMDDECAVLVEPFACALHGVLSTELAATDTVLILGCGTIGLLTIAAIRTLGITSRVLASAKYPKQAELARRLGADQVVPTGSALYGAVSEITVCEVYQPELGKPVVLGGVDTTFDCVGVSSTIDDAIRLTRAGGTTVLVGMPGIAVGVDWTSIWHKELTVRGAYAYGIEQIDGRAVRTFQLAMDLIGRSPETFSSLVDATFPLPRYRDALRHAMRSGSHGSVKTALTIPN